MKHTISLLIKLILLVSLISCTKSLVYSPSLNLPPKPLKKGQLQFLGGVGYLPETRPDKTKEDVALGAEFTGRYALNNRFTIQLKGWNDLSDNLEDSRSGFSFSLLSHLNDSSTIRFALMPTGAFVVGNSSFEGGGAAIPFIIWFNKFDPINFYTALGPVIGIRDLSQEKPEWGWGLMFNFGTALQIQKKFTLNIELSGINQNNKYDSRHNFVLVPSLNFGYLF